LGASDVVIGAGGGQVLVEFGEAMSVGGACGGIEQGSRASFGVACAGPFQYVHVGAGPGEQGSQAGQPFGVAQVGRGVPVADQPLLAVGAQFGAGAVRRLGLCGARHGR
jgi:hypothetical protein